MAHAFTSQTRPPRRRRGFGSVATFCRRLAKTLFDPYHPERHYMRGPGPKWQAKHSYANGEQAGR